MLGYFPNFLHIHIETSQTSSYVTFRFRIQDVLKQLFNAFGNQLLADAKSPPG
jgi:hypothetical protein